MKGLIIKDSRLLLQRKNFFIVLTVISFMLSFTTTETFVPAYMTMLVAMFAISSMSYDEYDNCYSFLMTLPVTSKIYVMEKYVYGAILSVIGWGVGMIINMIGLYVQHRTDIINADMILGTIVFIPVALLMIDIMLPVQLKFGMEKSRIVILLIGGIGVLIGYVLRRYVAYMPDAVVSIGQKLAQMSDGQVMIACWVLTLILTILSYIISYAIFDKKQF